MDRLFLDANILFSAAYRSDSALVQLWDLENVELLTSPYTIAEAFRNLQRYESSRISNLEALVENLTIVSHEKIREDDPALSALPDKDQPILAAAIAAGATHLITGDRRHFGKWFGKRVKGVLIQSPSEYLVKD